MIRCWGRFLLSCLLVTDSSAVVDGQVDESCLVVVVCRDPYDLKEWMDDTPKVRIVRLALLCHKELVDRSESVDRLVGTVTTTAVDMCVADVLCKRSSGSILERQPKSGESIYEFTVCVVGTLWGPSMVSGVFAVHLYRPDLCSLVECWVEGVAVQSA